MSDEREQFEKALADKLMSLTQVRLVIVQRPEDEEDAVYRNGSLTELIPLGISMALEESFVYCNPWEGGHWDCAEFIWTPAEPMSSSVPCCETKILGKYLERRHFIIGPPADAAVQQ
jgi:hypothetical protein